MSSELPRAGRALLTLCCALTAGTSAQGAACPDRQVVTVDVEEWARATRTITQVADLDRALVVVKLKPTAGRAPCSEGGEKAAARVIQVDTFPAALDAKRPVGMAIQVRGALCDTRSSALPEFQRGALYMPLGENRWCKTDAPFLDQDGSDRSAVLCEATTFGFEALVAPDEKVMRVVENTAWCGAAGNDRGGETVLSYWTLHNNALVELLSLQTSTGKYDSSSAIGWSTERSVELSSTYPKTLTIREHTMCSGDRDSEDPELREVVARYPCAPQSVEYEYRYDNGAYVRRDKKP